MDIMDTMKAIMVFARMGMTKELHRRQFRQTFVESQDFS
jgi:hypothetical protein